MPHAIFIWLTIALVSCAQFDAPPITKTATTKGQPGDYFVKQISQQKLIHPKQVVAMLQQSDIKSNKKHAYLIKNQQDAATLLLAVSRSRDVS
ncbi:hypothetical protein RS130_20645 [Paraglaciecola aquimarina]|uniref:Lipoprotein n=1 Tax=Paraglaciecola aquimarina TaxID=1235557 RepID=A0ABU3T1C1_9ALTE|nr:hypothetical protein [Paraglaciecola aquimarina]MDU0355977.1 hypothetical protein [Paraglaciecola aquimarina]